MTTGYWKMTTVCWSVSRVASYPTSSRFQAQAASRLANEGSSAPSEVTAYYYQFIYLFLLERNPTDRA